MTLIALDDVIFKIEVHVLNGMWLPAVDFFRNSATVQITSPKRARHLDEYTQNVLEEETRYDDVDLGVPSCCGAFTPSTRLVSRNDGSGSFLCRFRADSDSLRRGRERESTRSRRWRLRDSAAATPSP